MQAEQLVLPENLVLPNLLADRCDSDDVFLQDVDGRSATFADVEHGVRGWAAALGEAGFERGETVLVMAPNSFETIYAWLATARLGGIEVPINTAYRGSILTHVVNNSSARIAVVHADYLERFDAVADALTSLSTIVVVGGAQRPVASMSMITAEDLVHDGATSAEGAATQRPQRWDTACILYTSGTTGPSKGVIVPWGQVYATSVGCIPIDDLNEEDAWYSPFPLYHMSGKLALYSAALLGSRFVLRDGFSTTEFWPEVRRFGCTTSLLIGTTPAFLGSQPPRPDDADSPLRNVLMAPVGDDPEGFMARFGVRISTVFNMTEISAPVHSKWTLGPKGSCGRLRPGYQVRIVDAHDEEVPPRELGEIVVRSDEPWLLMNGYWKMPDKTVEAWRNQWFHTGDAGQVDEDGNFYFVDRQKDAIRHRGENVSSMELEAEVGAHSAVAECAAIGVPSELGEEDIMIVVVETQKDALEPEDLVRFLAERVPRFMVPRYITVLAELPKTPTEKVRKVALREEVGSPDEWMHETWDREAAGITLGK